MKGILFKPWKAKAIVESSLDRKWQTRRIIKPQPPEGYDYIPKMKAWVKPISDMKVAMVRTPKPRYQVGEVVYIKEALYKSPSYDVTNGKHFAYYKSDHLIVEGGRWEWIRDTLPSLFMPAWAARYFIKITGVRPERLQEITKEDVEAEGTRVWLEQHPEVLDDAPFSAKQCYSYLWDSINPKQKWETNPWVWRIAFVKADKP